MEFEYQVTLSPKNDEKWQELISDSKSRRYALAVYQLVVESDRSSVNAIFEKLHDYYREDNLEEGFSYLIGLYGASEEMLKVKFEQ